MAYEILMPKLGLTMTEGTVEEWKFREGDYVKKGDALFSVSTDKLTNDVESEAEGVLLKILLPAGETAPCKAVVGYLGQEGESVPGGAKPDEGTAAPQTETAPAAELAFTVKSDHTGLTERYVQRAIQRHPLYVGESHGGEHAGCHGRQNTLSGVAQHCVHAEVIRVTHDADTACH